MAPSSCMPLNKEKWTCTEPIRRVLKFLKTFKGLLTLIPTIVGAIDIFADFLPISPAIKMRAFGLAILFMTWAMFSEINRYLIGTADYLLRTKIRYRAFISIIIATFLAAVYWTAITTNRKWMPDDEVAIEAILWGLSFLVALVFERETRGFVLVAIDLTLSGVQFKS